MSNQHWSQCCFSSTRLYSGEEGTNHYICNACNEACDIVYTQSNDTHPVEPKFRIAPVKKFSEIKEAYLTTHLKGTDVSPVVAYTQAETAASELSTKVCGRCKEDKPLDQFHKKKHLIQSWCKVCTTFQNRRYYRANKARLDEKKIAYKKAHPEVMRKASAKAYMNDKDKAIARTKLREAVAKGEVPKSACEECGDVKVEFHHTNGYDRDNWYVGRWLCRKHHAHTHLLIREAQRREQDRLIAIKEQVV